MHHIGNCFANVQHCMPELAQANAQKALKLSALQMQHIDAAMLPWDRAYSAVVVKQS